MSGSTNGKTYFWRVPACGAAHAYTLRVDQILSTPKIGSFWLHENGDAYEVYDVTNEQSTRLDEYPVRVSYRRLRDNTRWSKDLLGFLKSRRQIGLPGDQK